MSAPLIAITGPRRGARAALALCSVGLLAAGARVRVLKPPYRPERLNRLQGVVIGGGVHIEPRRYAEQPTVEYEYDPDRDELELRVLEHATRNGLPVLGICRGAQLINVFRGGSLFQDLASHAPHAEAWLRRSVRACKWVTIAPESALALAIGTQRVEVNSLHRQAVRTLGRDLRVSARDDGDIVQAIESVSGEPAMIGVQWHPEFLLDRAPHRRLFRWVANTARTRVRAVEAGEVRA